MFKLSTLFASIAGLILVQTNANQQSVQETSTWDLNTRGIGNNNDEQNPSVGCILFGNAICYLYCYLAIEVYYFEVNTTGFCDDNQSCLCQYGVDANLRNNWSMKFDADYVYWAIRRSQPLYNRVFDLFSKPFHTGRELKKILHPIISPYQYSKLQIRDDSIAKILYSNDKVNKELVQRYVSDRLNVVFGSDGKNAFYTNYEMNFRDVLKDIRDEGTLYNIAFELRTLKNKKLESIWHEHLTTNHLQQPNIEILEPESLEALLTYAVTNEVIEQRDQMITDPVFGKAVHSSMNTGSRRTRTFHY